MTPRLFLEIIEHGLPGSVVTQFIPSQLVARVEYGGGVFDVSGGELDGFPIWLVTTPEVHLNEQTNAVMEKLDSMSDELSPNSRTWELGDAPWLIKRMRELLQEDCDEPVDPI